MPELRALIVDDEPLARRGLRQHLAAHPDVVVVGECRNGREALRAMEELAPDLVFLDVQMPGLDGFGVLRERGPERLPAVIFVTAYDDFAVAAFEAHALDYLVKPVSAARFDAALARARENARCEEALALRARLAALLAAHDGRPDEALAAAFFAGPVELGAGGPRLVVLYSSVPWIGVMAAGYAFGAVASAEPARRRRLCLGIGLSATLLFLLLRGLDLYGDPSSWRLVEGMPGWIAFLGATNYPASLVFLLMTLGPTIALVPALERARGPVARWLETFGRVPFFFYLLHIPLIHALAVGVSWLRTGEASAWLFANHPMGNPPPPEGYAWSLGLLYLVWAAAVVLLYPACRRFARLRSEGRHPWLKYL